MAQIHQQEDFRTVVTDPDFPAVRVVVGYNIHGDNWIGHCYISRPGATGEERVGTPSESPTKGSAIDNAFAMGALALQSN